ncbi:DUF5701 family protein [Modestobacter roseus]|uniref:Uncharacterized protein n=1 Tax=Modestobacter roseus TaxID=1181884 RepID=A0A562IW63_9ACTN|nr:DUF5701 family protein [Modestobacter roseus]MQA36091.1 hypothetical protein [Modestobacter roseus]TWH75053.1 hypothetical protein JD78_03604 [Modestobacter roseus]
MLPLPSLPDQAARLIALGVPELTGLSAAALTAAADGPAGALLVVHPELLPPSRLVPLVQREGRPAFVVADMTDVDDFTPIDAAAVPDAPIHLVHAPDRGDELANRSPDEALPAITGRGSSPLTLTEGLHWVLQQPAALERNRCFMTIGSRLRRPDGRLDTRTPALWLSNGTGRDGRERRHAPKVGWCWAGNRHTWLGFASTAGRSVPVPRAVTTAAG